MHPISLFIRTMLWCSKIWAEISETGPMYCRSYRQGKIKMEEIVPFFLCTTTCIKRKGNHPNIQCAVWMSFVEWYPWSFNEIPCSTCWIGCHNHLPLIILLFGNSNRLTVVFGSLQGYIQAYDSSISNGPTHWHAIIVKGDQVFKKWCENAGTRRTGHCETPPKPFFQA